MPIPYTTANAGYPGTSGSAFNAPQNNVLTASQKVTPAAGWAYVVASANDTVVLNTSGSTSETVLAKSAAALIRFDGSQVQIVNDGTADTGSGTVVIPLKGV